MWVCQPQNSQGLEQVWPIVFILLITILSFWRVERLVLRNVSSRLHDVWRIVIILHVDCTVILQHNYTVGLFRVVIAQSVVCSKLFVFHHPEDKEVYEVSGYYFIVMLLRFPIEVRQNSQNYIIIQKIVDVASRLDSTVIPVEGLVRSYSVV